MVSTPDFLQHLTDLCVDIVVYKVLGSELLARTSSPSGTSFQRGLGCSPNTNLEIVSLPPPPTPFQKKIMVSPLKPCGEN